MKNNENEQETTNGVGNEKRKINTNGYRYELTHYRDVEQTRARQQNNTSPVEPP